MTLPTTPMEWHTLRLSFNINNRSDFQFKFFEYGHLMPFKQEHHLNIDTWFCSAHCKKWHYVTEKGIYLYCNNCGNKCGKLDPIMQFGKYKGKLLSECDDDYQDWYLSTKK